MLKRIINKITEGEKEYQYRTFTFNADLTELLSSSYTEVAPFSLVYDINSERISHHLYAPPFWRSESIKPIKTPVSKLDGYQYRLKLAKNSMYPIQTLADINFINELADHLIQPNESIQMRITLKRRVGGWRGEEVLKYKHYRKGNISAIDNKLLRMVLSLDKEDEEVTRSNILDIENKIIQEQFEFDISLHVITIPKRIDGLEELIEESLQNLSHLNSLELKSVSNLNETFYFENQYVCLSEVLSLLGVEGVTSSVQEETDMGILEVANDDNMSDTGSQESIFNLLPLTNNKAEIEEEYQNIAEDIKKVMYRVKIVKEGVKIELDNEINGLSFIRCQYKIPSDIVITDITKKHKDIQAALGVASLTIEQGDKADTVAFLIPKTTRKPFYLGDVFANVENRKEINKLDVPFFIGLDPLGKPVFGCLSALKHFLIAGQTGGGKSVFMNQALLLMLMSMSPKELKMILIDPKQVEFSQFEKFPQVDKVITDNKEASKVLEQLILKMEERYELFKRSGVKGLKAYNEKNKNNPEPYIVIAIDEFADLRMSNPDVVDYVAMLGQKARGAGIHLIVATQRPDVKIIDGFIKDNLPSKICFRLGSNKSYQTIFGTGIPFTLLGNGHGVMKLEGQLKEFEQFQSSAISLDDEEEEKTYKKILRYINKNGHKMKQNDTETNENAIEIEEKQEEISDMDRLKRIIAETEETRIRELQGLLGIGTNKVTDLMAELVKEGWIRRSESGKRGYEITISGEELDKWRE